MDREIKFRAWDEKENHFWYFTLQEILERRMYYRGDWDERILRGKKTEYTGLKDKNGVEIYEGDILIFDNHKTRTVFKVKGGFAIESLDMDVGRYGKALCCPIESLGDEQNAGFIESQSKIIGNIYENPELLKMWR